jgi:hypothetical protein
VAALGTAVGKFLAFTQPEFQQIFAVARQILSATLLYSFYISLIPRPTGFTVIDFFKL